jgi:feruloyl esterase
MIAALDRWVDKGHAPTQILATHVDNGMVTRSRPLCPYPQTAAYKGAGSTDAASNFVCKAAFSLLPAPFAISLQAFQKTG